MLNHVELLGRLAQEPEIRYTQSGTPVASFDLAVQVPSKNKDAAPDYIPIVCWRERAEFCGRYLSKGRQIVVEGRISTRKWKDEKAGQTGGTLRPNQKQTTKGGADSGMDPNSPTTERPPQGAGCC